MDRYIEVIGEGQFIERASRFIAEVTLEVRATKDETAFGEATELAREAVAILRDAGLSEEEIIEGGSDVQRPWYWKKKVGQTASRKLIFKVADYSRLNRALERLEPLQSRNKERKTISVNMRQPEFEAGSPAKAEALRGAFRDAQQKASALAAQIGCDLGPVSSVEESGWAKRSSGFSGDEDWWGDSSRFPMGAGGVMLAGAAAAEPELELPKPTRTIFVKCRVRFGLVHP
jgi:uncharacterized protein YggE